MKHGAKQQQDAFRVYTLHRKKTPIPGKQNVSLEARITNYGATLTHLFVHNPKTEKTVDVILGFDRPQDYADASRNAYYFGCVVGRVANRIAKGAFQLSDSEDGPRSSSSYQLAVNNGPNALHGGLCGFDKRVWTEVHVSEDALTLEYISEDGEEGYPGRVRVRVTYAIREELEEVGGGQSLQILYDAQLVDGAKATLLNLTNHAYFNLTGGAEPTVHQHQLQLRAGYYLEKDETGIPTGKRVDSRTDPAMDFTQQRPLLLANGPAAGYDHYYVLDAPKSKDGFEVTERPRLAAVATSSQSGLRMSMFTTEPGLQLYTAYYVDNQHPGKSSSQPATFQHDRFAGFCLEASRFPDAIHSQQEAVRRMVTLRSGETYRQETLYRFDAL